MTNATKHEGQAFGINDQTKWHGQELGVNSNVPLVDAGTGQAFIIRQFEFTFNPKFLKELKEHKTTLNKQELFNSHWRQIEVTLWGDGLVARRDVEPKIRIKRNKYYVVLACEARFRTMINEKPQTLQEIIKPKEITQSH